MAYEQPNSGSDSMYSDSAPSEGGETPKKGEEQTAVIPKALLAGKEFKPGEEIIFKIVSIHDDEVEIAYATGEGDKEEKMDSAPSESAPAGGGDGGGMASMME